MNNARRPGRARSNTAHSYQERYEPVQEEILQPPPPIRPTIGSRSASSNRLDEPARARSNSGSLHPNRTSTFEGPTQLRRDESPAAAYSPNRVHSDLSIRTTRSSLRPVSRVYDNYQSDSTASHGNVSPFEDRSESPATSQGSYFSRTPSVDTAGVSSIKKGPPPPPPSRSTKPKPPPPPPSKRHLVGA